MVGRGEDANAHTDRHTHSTTTPPNNNKHHHRQYLPRLLRLLEEVGRVTLQAVLRTPEDFKVIG